MYRVRIRLSAQLLHHELSSHVALNDAIAALGIVERDFEAQLLRNGEGALKAKIRLEIIDDDAHDEPPIMTSTFKPVVPPAHGPPSSR
jgi:hypothetical protein